MLVHLKAVRERVVIELPVDAEVTGVVARAGMLFLRVEGKMTGELVQRAYWAWDNGEYMMHPTFGCVDVVKLGSSFWFVFEE